MKYLKTFEYYTEDYDVILYPGNKGFVRVDSVLKHKILSLIGGEIDVIEMPREKHYSSLYDKIYRQDDTLVFETKEGIKNTIDLEDVLISLNSEA